MAAAITLLEAVRWAGNCPLSAHGPLLHSRLARIGPGPSCNSRSASACVLVFLGERAFDSCENHEDSVGAREYPGAVEATNAGEPPNEVPGDDVRPKQIYTYGAFTDDTDGGNFEHIGTLAGAIRRARKYARL